MNDTTTSRPPSPRIVFVGAGNMASALIGGLIARGTAPASLQAIDPSASQRDALGARFGIATHAASGDPVGQADVIVMAVKPQQMREAVNALAPQIATQLIISVAAGVRATDLSRWLGGYSRIVRTMPNTPALIGLGATGLAMLAGGTDADRKLAESIMQAVGQTVWVDDESQLDAVTALSGSGPAYVFRFIESMIAAGTGLGLSPEQSRQLALQTVSGAAQLACASSEPVALLRERVTSKGGTTAAALSVFEARGLDAVVAQAMGAARDRSAELGDEFGR
ncbi:MAG: pyrroline-5-carboxylate reductase [Burkholderiales bacterium]|nr:pyrroline-5-carboxylate reductase [Burkholderiales bacterium]